MAKRDYEAKLISDAIAKTDAEAESIKSSSKGLYTFDAKIKTEAGRLSSKGYMMFNSPRDNQQLRTVEEEGARQVMSLSIVPFCLNKPS